MYRELYRRNAWFISKVWFAGTWPYGDGERRCRLGVLAECAAHHRHTSPTPRTPREGRRLGAHAVRGGEGDEEEGLSI